MLIDLEKLDLHFEEYESIKCTQEGAVALCKIDAFGFKIGIEVEGLLTGIKAEKDNILVQELHKGGDPTNLINDFLSYIRDGEYN